MYVTDTLVYSRCEGCTDKPLNLSGRSELQYCLKLNKAGKVIMFKASDGTYQYNYSGSGLNVEDIEDSFQITKISESEVIDINCDTYKYATRLAIGLGSSRAINIGNIINDIELFDSYEEAKANYRSEAYAKLKVENNIYIGGQVCIYLNKKEYCFTSDNNSGTFEKNKAIAMQAIVTDNTSGSTSYCNGTTTVNCYHSNAGLNIYLYSSNPHFLIEEQRNQWSVYPDGKIYFVIRPD